MTTYDCPTCGLVVLVTTKLDEHFQAIQGVCPKCYIIYEWQPKNIHFIGYLFSNKEIINIEDLNWEL